jgi:hypothetical protein
VSADDEVRRANMRSTIATLHGCRADGHLFDFSLPSRSDRTINLPTSVSMSTSTTLTSTGSINNSNNSMKTYDPLASAAPLVSREDEDDIKQ